MKRAAFACFAVAGLAGVAIIMITAMWWFVIIGIASVFAAWTYTGGKHPYGYLGLGELFVFVFFGLVATVGTVVVQLAAAPAAAWLIGAILGALACAILVANNLRDIDGDAAVGKRTLATRLGKRGTRVLYAALAGAAMIGVVATAALTTWWVLLGLAAIPILVLTVRIVLRGGVGRELIMVLKHTGTAQLVCAVGIAAGFAIGRVFG